MKKTFARTGVSCHNIRLLKSQLQLLFSVIPMARERGYLTNFQVYTDWQQGWANPEFFFANTENTAASK